MLCWFIYMKLPWFVHRFKGALIYSFKVQVQLWYLVHIFRLTLEMEGDLSRSAQGPTLSLYSLGEEFQFLLNVAFSEFAAFCGT